MRLPFSSSRLFTAVSRHCLTLLVTLLASGISSFAQPPASSAQGNLAPAGGEAAAKPAVVLHATWDSRYLYFAFQVDDSDLTGTNARPFSHPEQDDSVAVYFENGPNRPKTPDANTHAMIVSVAQGLSLLDGDQSSGSLIVPAKPDYSVKFGVVLQGTLNRSDDHDKGYTITLAVPIAVLGLTAADLKPGLVLGFNAVVRSRTANALSSLSPKVKSEADVPSPANWSQITLLAPDGSGGASAAGINAPEADPKGTPPLIDGVYRDLDWPIASRMTFDSPDKPRAIAVVAPAVTVDFAKSDLEMPPLDFSKPLAGIQRLLMARYVPTYQADRRKTGVPQRGIFGPNGAVGLPEQPATGVGPWLSSDRLAWHMGEMTEMRRDGVDVALVELGGPRASNSAFDEKALLVLVSALREMSARGTPAPQIALCVDVARLTGPSDQATPDLAISAGRDSLYGAVRRWTELVPAEFRAKVLLPESGAPSGAGIVAAYPVFLSDAAGVIAGVDSSGWSDSLRARFAADFGRATGGATLAFVGIGQEWSHAGTNLAAVMPSTTGKGTGALSTFLVQPGSETATRIVASRRGGATYQASWEAALAADATWIIIDSWNDFTDGSEVTPSRQYGPQYSDLTRIYAIQASGLKPKDVRWLENDAPRRMFPGQVVTTTVKLQNVGSAVLRGTDGVALVYRWKQNGAVVAEGPLALPLSEPVFPTKDVSIPIGLAAAQIDKEGHFNPLPPGEYVAEIDLVQKGSEGTAAAYFSETNSSAPLRIPITVRADIPDYVEFYGTTCPTVLRGGETIPVRVRLRWMGATTLGLADASLVYQIVSEDGKTAIKTGTVPIPSALPPGQWITIPTTLQLSDATVPLSPANPELRRQAEGASGYYRVRWLLTRTQSVDPIPGEYEEAVAVYPADDAAEVLTQARRVDPVDPSASIPIDVRVVNRGASSWTKGAFSVGYHWYDADGLEADWKPNVATPIAQDVKPGEDTTLSVVVQTPDHEGDFILAIDIVRNNDQSYLSTHAVTRSGDISLIPIRVKSGRRLKFVDLSRQFDTDVLANGAKPGDGNIDGEGHTFPAESFPPDHFGIVAALSPTPEGAKGVPGKDMTAYPSGYYFEASPAARQVSFRYGPDEDGAKNAVTCSGQSIEVEHGRFYGLHAAVTATGGASRPLPLVLHYRDGSTQTVSGTVADWNHLPSNSDTVAVTSHIERGKDADTVGPCTVWHVIFPVNARQDLVSITLPQDPKIKVFALTLERS